MTKPLIPNPLRSDTEYLRYYHHDIAGAELSDLQDELYALRPLLWGLGREDWLRQRVKALNTELSKRRANARFALRGD